MRVAVDVMGGDHAPAETVKGCVEAANRIEELGGVDQIIMVGQEEAINNELMVLNAKLGPHLSVVHAAEVVEMAEAPASAIRRKRDNSISRCMDLIKEGEAQAMVSAGNSGAVSTAALIKLGRIKGVERPAIACVLPTRSYRPMVLIDAGATMDCEAQWLVQFAIMGSLYAEAVLGVDNPRIGLLSIGNEEDKGNEVTKKAYHLLNRCDEINFRGNVEGHDIFKGETDVIVCDGFVGNAVLKTTESVALAIAYWLRQEFTRSLIRKIGALLLKGALRSIKRRMDPELYGGAVLMGVPGICIVTHGASSHRAIFNAIRVSAAAINNGMSDTIAEKIAISACAAKESAESAATA
jgi:glycerol-3-phosphate acyltransferase PlsX